jgi:molecular chaperone DnaK (HSP70)
VAILSGNTDLLEKAKLEKQITTLESERQAFNRSKSSARFRLEDIQQSIEGNNKMVSRMQNDWNSLMNRVQKDDSGNILNLIQIDGVNGSNPKAIGLKLNEMNENIRTNEEYKKIGTLYGFKILVKTEASMKDGFDFKENRFFIEGESKIKYTYNNGHIAKDPKLASSSFLRALERIPSLIGNHKSYAEKAAVDLPVLKEVVNSSWKKEDKLKQLKSELSSLERKIQLSLNDNQTEKSEKETVQLNSNPAMEQRIKVG